MSIKILSWLGNYLLEPRFDANTNDVFYDVYYAPQTDDECGCGEYIGEYQSIYDYDDEPVLFINDFDTWIERLHMLDDDESNR